MFDLLSHMNREIASLVADVLRLSVRNPRQMLFLKSFRDHLAAAQALREQNEVRGQHVPPFLIASITSSCNLTCAGCYARANQACGSAAAGRPLAAARWDRPFTEAQEMGICFILLAGGEPLLRPDVLDSAARHADIIFPVFTNGTLLGEQALERFDMHRNLVPVISLEGGREATDARRGPGVFDSIREAMGQLKEKKILYGVSITVMRENISDVTDETFIKGLKSSGCSLMFFIEYVPADGVSKELAPTDTERRLLDEAGTMIRKKIKMIPVLFPGDEKHSGGCLAAGRGFVHINVDGDLEPCPFSPYSDTNLSERTLAEALNSPFLKRMREGGMLTGEHAGGCLLHEKREEVERLLRETAT